MRATMRVRVELGQAFSLSYSQPIPTISTGVKQIMMASATSLLQVTHPPNRHQNGAT